jgi:hypothetical protein
MIHALSSRFPSFRFGFAALAISVAMAASAQAGQARLGLHWAPTYTMPSGSGVTNVPAGAFSAIGGGLGLTYMFGRMVGLEADGYFLTRGLSSTSTNNAYAVDTLLKIEPKPWLSLGVGIFYETYASGNIVSVSGRRVADSTYGLQFGGGFRFPVGMHVSLLTQAYYRLGLNNQTTVTNGNFTYSSVMGVVGIEFHGANAK